jgi:hypothetical protein
MMEEVQPDSPTTGFCALLSVIQSIEAFLRQAKRLKPDEKGFEALSLISNLKKYHSSSR